MHRLTPDAVGPVLEAGAFARAIAVAVQARYPEAVVRQTGGYVRVTVVGGLQLTRTEVEAAFGQAVRFPQDLERVLLSFKGKLELSDERAAWVP